MTVELPSWPTLLAAARRATGGSPPTARELVRLGETMFRRAGLGFRNSHGTARADARAAVFHVLDILDHDDGYLDVRVTDVEVVTILDLFEARLTERVPVPWLTGVAFHAGKRFAVEPGVFVPRGLVHHVLADVVRGMPPGGRVLELCTGCGALGILAALAREDVTVRLGDVSEAASTVAQANVRRFGLSARVSVATGDLYDVADGRYDLIIAHPPYISNAAPIVPTAEPGLALFGGDDGLDVVRRIVAGAAAHLAPGGRVLLELGSDHERAGRIRGVRWLPIDGCAAGIALVDRPDAVVIDGTRPTSDLRARPRRGRNPRSGRQPRHERRGLTCPTSTR